jgi:hypothetical protein
VLQVKRDKVQFAGDAGEIEASGKEFKDIDSLRDSIQLFCQATNPLRKTMDYLAEDVDSMNKEMNMWKKEGENYGVQILENQK